MWNAGLDESQARIKIAGRNINNLRYTDHTTLMAESEEEQKSLLMKVKEESEKAVLKLNIKKMKIMASGPITSWQIDGETVETVSDFILGGLQNHCRWWLQPWNYKKPAPWKKSYNQSRQHIKKQRHYFVNKGPSSQGYGFSSSHVWMWKLSTKELMLLNCGAGEDFWECLGQQGDQTNQSERKSVLNSHWKHWRWSWSFNILAIWCKELTQWKRPWCWERLKAGREGEDRRWNGWKTSPTQ